MKIDPYNHEKRFNAWKERNKEEIEGISKINSDLTLKYLSDMEKGINVSSKSVKGSRSYSRLNSLKIRMIFFSKRFKEFYNLDDVTKINEEQLLGFFSDLKKGLITKEGGEKYQSIETCAKIFKAFWHWWMKINRKNGIEILDITSDLDTTQEKPKWVYLNEEQVKKIYENARYDYKVLIMFLFDTGIRAPTELINIKVSDFYNDFKELNIREETSKTFGRRIKLMLSSDLIREYVKFQGLTKDSYIFGNVRSEAAGKYLKRLATKLFGDGETEAGGKYSEISLYDFRHISCCYWLPRYKSESALKYRFGWKKSDKIHYYSELLGMKDTISQEDLLVDVTKTEIEKQLIKSEKDKELMQEKIMLMEMQMKQILERVNLTQEQIQIIKT